MFGSSVNSAQLGRSVIVQVIITGGVKIVLYSEGADDT